MSNTWIVVADTLDHARMENQFDQLVLVAAPQFLGNMRKAMNEQVNKMVKTELDKNLVNMSAAEIIHHLPKGVLA